jgi:hypothetical protein
MASVAAPIIASMIVLFVLVGLPLLARRVRRRGTGSDVLGPFEEMWHPAAHRVRQESQVQEERRDDAPSPDNY